MTIPDEPQAHNIKHAVPMADSLTTAATEVTVQGGAVPKHEVENLSGNIGIAGEAMNLLEDHKGKLAIGVAATLGLMVFYRWREKRLAKTEPEEYARLQRLKVAMRQSDDQIQPKAARKDTRFRTGKNGTTGDND